MDEQISMFAGQLNALSRLIAAKGEAAAASSERAAFIAAHHEPRPDLRLIRAGLDRVLATVTALKQATTAQITAISIPELKGETRIIVVARWTEEFREVSDVVAAMGFEGRVAVMDRTPIRYFLSTKNIFESVDTARAAYELLRFLGDATDDIPAAAKCVRGERYVKSRFEIAKADEFAKEFVGLIRNFISVNPDSYEWRVVTAEKFTPSRVEIHIQSDSIEIRVF